MITFKAKMQNALIVTENHSFNKSNKIRMAGKPRIFKIQNVTGPLIVDLLHDLSARIVPRPE